MHQTDHNLTLSCCPCNLHIHIWDILVGTNLCGGMTCNDITHIPTLLNQLLSGFTSLIIDKRKANNPCNEFDLSRPQILRNSETKVDFPEKFRCRCSAVLCIHSVQENNGPRRPGDIIT